MRRRSQADFELAMRLAEAGLRDSEISRVTGIPRPTLSAWRHNRGRRYHDRLATANSRWRPAQPAAYCYLLGVYLGDGCLDAQPRGGASLIVSLDLSYPAIIDTVERSIRTVFSDVNVARVFPKDARLTVLRASHPALPFAFPQHGAGRKHTRTIMLTDWQRTLTDAHPRELLRGLDPLGWLQDRQPIQDHAAERACRRVRVSALLLLEPLRRHPGHLLRAL
jgi:hypothetical protein